MHLRLHQFEENMEREYNPTEDSLDEQLDNAHTVLLQNQDDNREKTDLEENTWVGKLPEVVTEHFPSKHNVALEGMVHHLVWDKKFLS